MTYAHLKTISLPHFHLLSWKRARLVVALEKMAGSHAEYVRDGEPFSKGGQPNAGSLKPTDGIDGLDNLR